MGRIKQFKMSAQGMQKYSEAKAGAMSALSSGNISRATEFRSSARNAVASGVNVKPISPTTPVQNANMN